MPKYSKEAQKKKPWHEVTASPAERKAFREKMAKQNDKTKKKG